MLNKDIDQSVKKWRRGSYEQALNSGPVPRTGWLYGPYGMRRRGDGVYGVVHLNTGYRVFELRYSFATSKNIVEHLCEKFDARRIKSPKSRLAMGEYKQAVMSTKARFKDAF